MSSSSVDGSLPGRAGADEGVFRGGWVAVLAVAGLVAASASAYVHYQLSHDPAYSSSCDVSSTFSCTSAYASEYGSIRGIPVAILGVVWFATVLVLLAARRTTLAALADNVPGYVFAWATVGLSVVLYLGYAAFFVLHTVCLLCIVSYVAVTGIFLLSGTSSAFPMTSLPRRMFTDLRSLVASPVALLAALVFLGAAGSAVAFFPRVEARVSASEAEQTPVPEVTDAQKSEVERWYESQPHEQVPVDGGGATVVIVKFNDYQCPPCRMTYEQYRPIRAKYDAQPGGKVKFITKDFPLDSECNTGVQGTGPHPDACEAAVAVRLAREKGKGEAMEAWLFANQPTVTTAGIKQAVKDLAGVTDYDARYASVLEQVKADAALGGLLGVRSTPTFFVNGVRVVGGLAPQYLEAVIAYELRKSAK
ncbi:MAG: vitamin K epoxide reductase family protein [Vicinamibacterales bacterium]